MSTWLHGLFWFTGIVTTTGISYLALYCIWASLKARNLSLEYYNQAHDSSGCFGFFVTLLLAT